MSAASATEWLEAHEEDHVGSAASLNQYWYSAPTIDSLVSVVRQHVLTDRQPRHLSCAFVSTPSLFFALPKSERHTCRVFDFDRALGVGEPGYVFYDYNEPHNLPEDVQGAFECVVIDPPFITADVWRLYAEAALKLLAPTGGLVMLTTVIENAQLLKELLGVRPNIYLPSIPNLPYQYGVFTNFDAPQLSQPNPEVPHDPETFLAAAQSSGGSTNAPSHEVRANEIPIKGAGASYDFEELIRRAEAAEAAEAERAATG